MQMAKTLLFLAAALLAGCSGQVVLLQSPDGGAPDGESPWDGSSGGGNDAQHVGYADASSDQWGTGWQPDAGAIDSSWGYDASFYDATVADGSVSYYDASVYPDACGPWGICTDDASVNDAGGCAQWCCEPPAGGRGFPMLVCVAAGVTCTLPASDCQFFDAGQFFDAPWWGD
jgi:hypothetical protein